ncbi:hypothetical protein ACMU_18135 [Actibacterium mucosum KCTC 23349]|uniref:Integral membrane protein n=2 Tax=Actibacterium TaxID=1433986 RepID=A0A037ZFH0_9RHOB|nr:hypothetical protein ACMU_18135 [Actibacterium mucosum KCTC 23349]
MHITTLFLIPFATLAYAFVGGVFLAFSDFVMRALALTSGHGGVDAMQKINREVFRWIFMPLFLGMAAGSVAIAAYGGFALTGTGGTLIMLSGLVYLIGCFGVTIVFNVPMNNALAELETTGASARDYWVQTYLPRWTFWNSVRTLACALSAALLLYGQIWMHQGFVPAG